ncbi:ATP synthase F1 subunit gamma [Clostridium cylindrosporum]|uniref:ATP synthase gamma chain n=1 Tax=Clostridium cylindrosporum DSM 605 TaxID=1121307 RepID=A0A0J8DEV7_CLOCY|nr:ATP synthase F1 subunit gamma [Clostridium cylindrosporum]KMT22779.1 ATP synthase gamma chain AtpG [Clostridium cylindrosporum DSM 605]
MAGAGLLDLKRRIKSVTSTRKITKAMGLVATAKFRKIRERAEGTTPYFEKFESAVKGIALSSEVASSKYFNAVEGKKDIYIVIGSDSGLCGGYNTNIFSETVRAVEGKNVSLITVGQKARTFFSLRNFDTMAEYVELGPTPSYKDCVEIIRPAIKAFEQGEASNVYVVYTKFHSPVKQTVEFLKVLPMEKEEGAKGSEAIFEPSAAEIFDYIVPKYINTTMFYAVVNAIASEYSSRMSAMDNATKNADELIDKLKLQFNRARQSSITQEITEIVGGAEALHD